ncbi:MAG TPA: hypothetical protein VFF35_11350, partial [Bacteroidia bacterium]|nr:hypothetical protein [Bacteroidia bacterium]
MNQKNSSKFKVCGLNSLQFKLIAFVFAFFLFYCITIAQGQVQGQGNPGPFFQFGGNNSSNNERLGLKSNSNLSLITSDLIRMEITKGGDVKFKEDVFLDKHPGQPNEHRLMEITPGGKLQPMQGGLQALQELLYKEPESGQAVPDCSPTFNKPKWVNAPYKM